MPRIPIRYCFTFGDGSQEIINLKLDAQTLELKNDLPEDLPAWTALGFHQCPNCPITTDTHPRCPLAVHLVNTVNRFRGKLSYHEIHLNVVTPERIFSKPTTLQSAISSLMGLISATCGCPLTAPLRPMARFHLPLASNEETIYRVASMYLMVQYFLRKKGKVPDQELGGLIEIYKDIQVVNNSFMQRLRDASQTESTVDAMVLLDSYAQIMPEQIEDSLESIAYLFDDFTQE
ncbi:MAG TPA: hypothetical protein ENN05_06530 [Deltaproteobacteria bacterium]|nr:hypothetical protein [Deltaproteobacteria bacterium]